jgi:hypothetical protein
MGWETNFIQGNPRETGSMGGTDYDTVFNCRQTTFDNVFRIADKR